MAGTPTSTSPASCRSPAWNSSVPSCGGRFTLAPLFHLTGLEFTEVGVGTATSAMPATPWWQSGAGVFTGGVTAFVADAALGGAIHTTLPPKRFVATSQLSMDFVRAAYVHSERLIARARQIQVSRAQGLSETTIEDGLGRLLAQATSRCVLLSMPFDPPEPPESFPPVEPMEARTRTSARSRARSSTARPGPPGADWTSCRAG